MIKDFIFSYSNDDLRVKTVLPSISRSIEYFRLSLIAVAKVSFSIYSFIFSLLNPIAAPVYTN
ncbi:hypothetical protein NSA50_14415 [Clostridium sp. DSM 100503]|uniref:hypothetical protein n=1 Tax=Clostridium sp. DSM 100503 TaxID=2963282 RepID=UPI00214A4C55|nr:hypothetical protein [Clostridium sp. DSM 100503]MCR1952227.1 hypothetical protein [Clostridium sp. DSM 100503]